MLGDGVLRRDDYLTAIVACWLDLAVLRRTGPVEECWVDGPNDPRAFVDGGYMDAQDIVDDLVRDGLLESHPGQDWHSRVRPTAKGLFEVLR